MRDMTEELINKAKESLQFAAADLRAAHAAACADNDPFLAMVLLDAIEPVARMKLRLEEISSAASNRSNTPG